MSETKYLITEYWHDPWEKNNSEGYKPVGYVDTLEEAEKAKLDGGFLTEKDTWKARYYPDKKIWKIKYEEIKQCRSPEDYIPQNGDTVRCFNDDPDKCLLVGNYIGKMGKFFVVHAWTSNDQTSFSVFRSIKPLQ